MPTLNELLSTALHNNDLAEAANLIQKGADVNQSKKTIIDDVYPLHGAIDNTPESIFKVNLILDNGADPNAINPYNLKDPLSPDISSALHKACIFSNLDVIRRLLSHKEINIEIKNAEGLYPLMVCSTTDAAELLLNAGADPDSVDKNGRTALYRRSVLELHSNDPDIAILILKHGGDPNKKSAGEKTPFHGCRHAHVVKSLLDHGGDPDVADKYGIKPVQITRHYSGPHVPIDPEIFTLIRKHILKKSSNV